MRVEFGEWLPDIPPHGNPGCVEAKNLIPLVNSFGPLKNLSPFSNALSSACLGAFWMPDLAGAATNFAGDASSLYLYTDSTAAWGDVSNASASYAAAVSWEFEKFGNRCIAVDIANDPQYYDLGSSSKFADIAGSPPKAKYVATVRDFLVLANLESFPNRVQWSGFNNSEIWTQSLATQSDRQDLLGAGGQIQAIVPGDYGVIIQENSIWRMDYVGPPIVFQFDEVETSKGTPAPGSVVSYGTFVFFYDNSGFQRFDGQSAVPIGNNRVDEWFKNNAESLSSIVGVVDRRNKLVMWAFKSSSSVIYNDRIIFYNFASDRWAWGEVTTQYLSEKLTGQLTLDDLDTPLPQGIDIDSIPMDSLFFSQELNVQGFSSTNKAGSFDGSAMAGVIISKEVSNDGSSTEVRGVRPLVDGGDVTVQIGYRHRLDQGVTFTDSVSLNRLGEAQMRLNARYQRYRLDVSNQFDYLQGVEIVGRSAGRR